MQLVDPKSYQRYGGPKFCGGYHPDWCLEWKEGEDIYQILICFGCHEAYLYGPKNELCTDLDEKAYNQLKELLTPYRKNRPTPQEE